MRVLWDRRELHIKVVYYGPPLSGKTTNLRQLQENIAPQHRSDLVSLDTEGDRTLFFDLLEVNLGRIGGLQPRVSLYTVPGQPRYQRVRELVLRGADGVVFVADSAPHRLRENHAMWQQMWQQMYKLRIQDVPVVLQLNKRDVPNPTPVAQFRQLLRHPKGEDVPIVEAQAKDNVGVRETFTLILKRILQR